jgi:hypothetical protein
MTSFVAATGREGAPWGWTDEHRRLQVAVVGASGAVGEELLALLLAARHPIDGLDLLARRYGKLEIGPERTRLSLRPWNRSRRRAICLAVISPSCARPARSAACSARRLPKRASA